MSVGASNRVDSDLANHGLRMTEERTASSISMSFASRCLGEVVRKEPELGTVEAEAGSHGRVRNVQFEERMKNDIMMFD